MKLKSKRVVKCPSLEDALTEWIIQCQERRICLSWDMVQKKAERFENSLNIPENDRTTFSGGW